MPENFMFDFVQDILMGGAGKSTSARLDLGLVHAGNLHYRCFWLCRRFHDFWRKGRRGRAVQEFEGAWLIYDRGSSARGPYLDR